MSRMTLDLNDVDEAVVKAMMAASGLDKTNLIRCALRFYQVVDLRQRDGYELAFVRDGVVLPVVVIGPALRPVVGEETGTSSESMTELRRERDELRTLLTYEYRDRPRFESNRGLSVATPSQASCHARQHADQMACGHCGNVWDVNDPSPPMCRLARVAAGAET